MSRLTDGQLFVGLVMVNSGLLMAVDIVWRRLRRRRLARRFR